MWLKYLKVFVTFAKKGKKCNKSSQGRSKDTKTKTFSAPTERVRFLA